MNNSDEPNSLYSTENKNGEKVKITFSITKQAYDVLLEDWEEMKEEFDDYDEPLENHATWIVEDYCQEKKDNYSIKPLRERIQEALFETESNGWGDRKGLRFAIRNAMRGPY